MSVLRAARPPSVPAARRYLQLLVITLLLATVVTLAADALARAGMTRGVGSHRLERPEPSDLVFEQARPGRGFFFPARSLTRRCSDGVNISACAAGRKASRHEAC